MELDPFRVLRVIEGLCMTNEPKDLDKYTSEEKLISQIYMIAHSAQPGSCHNVHDDWRNETLKTEQSLIDNNIISRWGEPEPDMSWPPFPGEESK